MVIRVNKTTKFHGIPPRRTYLKEVKILRLAIRHSCARWVFAMLKKR